MHRPSRQPNFIRRQSGTQAHLNFLLNLGHDGAQELDGLFVVLVKVGGDALQEGDAHPLGDLLVPALPVALDKVPHVVHQLLVVHLTDRQTDNDPELGTCGYFKCLNNEESVWGFVIADFAF